MFQDFADWIAFTVLGLNPQSSLGQAMNFFFYDTPKILALLTVISFPQMIILCNVIKPQLIGIFAGIVALAIMLTGYLFNAIL